MNRSGEVRSEVTLITGASQGIGYYLALELARRGDAVAVLARRRAELEALVARITDEGGRAMAVTADVTDRSALAQAAERVRSEFGPITRLVANAGGGQPTHIAAYDAECVEDTIRLNLIGTANAVGVVLDDMRARGRGHLVAMGSLAALRGLPTAAAYSAAKAGVANFMESLAIDLWDTGIDVTLLEPGFVAKPDSKKRRMRMPMDVATRRMASAIIARRRLWRGPASLVFAANILRLLPFPAYRRVMAGQGRATDA
ncbi:SDR family NAD(P)-dependent oxidoreductase [Salinisphaera hydrothermalis]|uniref:Oxidoreductase, short chain dehydrogenase n=1 Tax=Salinisphaera hydrothermalis (strain C41B8) TaxID=1304275 RepID=A0A084IP57_SALHC|nr:SDR family NAD(P)-dependent oxidoreductase [Salinisphaera hydrothermalis]KEZ78491.1 oxidoreductase, short chain dehydrogenase [Salinisphaera hydrothermalis C41B8]